MPTLRRILKFIPATALGLIFLIWLVSLLITVGISTDAAEVTKPALDSGRGLLEVAFNSPIQAIRKVRFGTQLQ